MNKNRDLNYNNHAATTIASAVIPRVRIILKSDTRMAPDDTGAGILALTNPGPHRTFTCFAAPRYVDATG